MFVLFLSWVKFGYLAQLTLPPFVSCLHSSIVFSTVSWSCLEALKGGIVFKLSTQLTNSERYLQHTAYTIVMNGCRYEVLPIAYHQSKSNSHLFRKASSSPLILRFRDWRFLNSSAVSFRLSPRCSVIFINRGGYMMLSACERLTTSLCCAML